MIKHALTAIVERHLSTHPEPLPCPACGGVLQISEATTEEPYLPGGYAILGRELPTRERECVAAFCSACEFVTEIQL